MVDLIGNSTHLGLQVAVKPVRPVGLVQVLKHCHHHSTATTITITIPSPSSPPLFYPHHRRHHHHQYYSTTVTTATPAPFSLTLTFFISSSNIVTSSDSLMTSKSASTCYATTISKSHNPTTPTMPLIFCFCGINLYLIHSFNCSNEFIITSLWKY